MYWVSIVPIFTAYVESTLLKVCPRETQTAREENPSEISVDVITKTTTAFSLIDQVPSQWCYTILSLASRRTVPIVSPLLTHCEVVLKTIPNLLTHMWPATIVSILHLFGSCIPPNCFLTKETR